MLNSINIAKKLMILKRDTEYRSAVSRPPIPKAGDKEEGDECSQHGTDIDGSDQAFSTGGG
jgi:hypothetical protein